VLNMNVTAELSAFAELSAKLESSGAVSMRADQRRNAER